MKRFVLLALPMMLFAPNFLWAQEPPNSRKDDIDAIVVAEVKNITSSRYERFAEDPGNVLFIGDFGLEMVVKVVEKGDVVKVGDTIHVSGRWISKTPFTLSLYRSQTFRAIRVPGKCARVWIVREDSEIDMSIPAQEKRIEQALAKLAKGEIDAKDFAVTYDDMNPFHGGLRLSIVGDGDVLMEAVRQKVGQRREVSAADMKRLIELLNKHQAWEQRTSHRQVIQPGESTARLTIRYKLDSVTMWEYHSEMRKNDRLIAIREEMKRAAWVEVPK